ncbi:hypothetical protein D9M71_635180 [compost metagenome]
MELVMIVRTTAEAVTMPETSRAWGKSVSSQALAKFSGWMDVGSSNPVPPSWSGDFNAVTTVKYSGTRTVSESTATRTLSGTLTLGALRFVTGWWCDGGPETGPPSTACPGRVCVLTRNRPPCVVGSAAAAARGPR